MREEQMLSINQNDKLLALTMIMVSLSLMMTLRNHFVESSIKVIILTLQSPEILIIQGSREKEEFLTKLVTG